MKVLLNWDNGKEIGRLDIPWDDEWAESEDDLDVNDTPDVYQFGDGSRTIDDLNEELRAEIENAIKYYVDFEGKKQVIERAGLDDRMTYQGTVHWSVIPETAEEQSFLEDLGWKPPEPVREAIKQIQERRKAIGQAPMDPWAAGWSVEDILREAKRLKGKSNPGRPRPNQAETETIARALRGRGMGKDEALREARKIATARARERATVQNVAQTKIHPSRKAVAAYVAKKVREGWRATATGGLADGRSLRDFKQSSVVDGLIVELEHTSDWEMAMRIAVDHLVEDPQYYKKLATIENPTSSDDVAALRERLLQTHPLQNLWLATLDNGNAVRVDIIRVPPDRRGAGHGDQVMSEITAWADRHDVTLVLTPSADWDASNKARGKARLDRWYRRHGFVPNKGRRKDFRFTDTMIRTPKTSPPSRTGGRR